MKRWLVLASIVPAVGGVGLSSTARAETIDMAALVCGELITMPIEEVVVVGAWMSGYFNAKADNTVLDTDTMAETGALLGTFCEANPDVPIMDAVAALFSGDQ